MASFEVHSHVRFLAMCSDWNVATRCNHEAHQQWYSHQANVGMLNVAAGSHNRKFPQVRPRTHAVENTTGFTFPNGKNQTFVLGILPK
eukprot:1258917-Amphidinium_carterae.1